MIPAISGRIAFAVGNLFKASQDRIVVKGSALDNDVIAKFGGIGNLDHFI